MTKILAFALTLCATNAPGQGIIGRLGQDLRLELETTTTVGGGDYAPLWLSSNRYGLSSVQTCWNYERVALHRDMTGDSAQHWRLGYGIDAAVMFGGERTVAITEAFFEAAWKKIYLTAGSKRQPLMLKNERLSSGGLSYGINARPIPQVRLGFEYFTFPGTKGWWQWQGHISYGWMTDGRWQKSWSLPTANRTEHTLYHEKALYWKFGNERVFPLDLQFGLQWATEFGGTAYNFAGRDITLESTSDGVMMQTGLKAYWNALVVGGHDITDGRIRNTEGNHLGSWNVALTYRPGNWMIRAYGERYFDDVSQLGVLYGISDHLIGIEVGLPKNPYLSTLVLEHFNSRCQSGAVYHDWSTAIPDKMNGRDNYYNHNIYTGWQNYGMSIGSPLITSPLYNAVFGKCNNQTFFNNRVRAWHVGLAGTPIAGLEWRLLMTFSRNWGTYDNPLEDPVNQCYMALEAGYAPQTWHGWALRAMVGMDHGRLLGNNSGMQLTAIKSFNLNSK